MSCPAGRSHFLPFAAIGVCFCSGSGFLGLANGPLEDGAKKSGKDDIKRSGHGGRDGDGIIDRFRLPLDRLCVFMTYTSDERTSL